MNTKMTEKEEETAEFLSGDKSEVQLDESDSHDSLPVDRGWAWIVLIGAVVSMTIVFGVWRTTGIFFIMYQERFYSSAAMTSLISAVSNAAFSITGPIIMTVGVKFLSRRQFVVMGSGLAVLSFLIISVSNHISLVIISHGVLQGMGFGMIEPCVVSMVTRHFKKRQSLANSFTAASGSLGGLVFPLLVTFLNRFYGYFGCMLLLAAINLHIGAMGLTFRPESYYIQTSTLNKKNTLLLNGDLEKDNLTHKTSVNQTILKYFNYKLFSNPLFVLFQAAFLLLTGGLYVNMFFTPPMAKDFGITDTNIAVIVTVYAIVDLCFRIFSGFIADFSFCRRSTLLAMSFFVFGINANLVRLYSTFELFLLYTIIQGVTGAPLMSLYPGIITDYLNKEHLDSTIGFAMLGLGISTSLFMYIGGVLRDLTGSYILVLHLSGAIAIVGSVIMICLPIVEKSTNRNAETDVETNTENQDVNQLSPNSAI